MLIPNCSEIDQINLDVFQYLTALREHGMNANAEWDDNHLNTYPEFFGGLRVVLWPVDENPGKNQLAAEFPGYNDCDLIG